MRKFVKFGGLTVGLGMVVGLVVAGWLWFHRSAPVAVDSRGGSVSLNESPTPSADADGLRVAQPIDGGVGTVLGSAAAGSVPANNAPSSGAGDNNGAAGGSAGSAAGSGGAAGTSATLTPDEFTQYEQYNASQGALYGDLRPGTGDEVKAGSVVTVNYRGWLTNGKLFDESYSKGQPFTFTEGAHAVISGWEQGLFGMKAGGKRRLIVPSAYGYGAQAHDPIPANSMLIFDVELVSVKNQ